MLGDGAWLGIQLIKDFMERNMKSNLVSSSFLLVQKYIAPHQWGDGGDNLVVLGKPRHKKGLIECIIKREHICNWRLQKIYPSKVLNRMNCSKYH